MKKMILFVLLWQGYVAAADSELRQLLAPDQSTSVSINNQKGAEVALVNLGGTRSSMSLALRADLQAQKEILEQSSTTRDYKRFATALVIPGLGAVGGAAAAGWLGGPSFFWVCNGALTGAVLGVPSIPLVAKCYGIWVDQPVKDEMDRIDQEIRNLEQNPQPLNMRED